MAKYLSILCQTLNCSAPGVHLDDLFIMIVMASLLQVSFARQEEIGETTLS